MSKHKLKAKPKGKAKPTTKSKVSKAPKPLEAPPVVAEHRVWKGAGVLERFLRPVGALVPDEDNARARDDRAVEALANSLQAFGQTKPVVIYERNVVIAGNGTLAAAMRLGWTHLAAIRFTGSDAEARAYGIADNRTGELSVWDEPTLRQALEERPTLLEFGFTANDVARLAARLGEDAARQAGFGERPLGTTLYSLYFDEQRNLDMWNRFLRGLKDVYPAAVTDSARLFAWLRDVAGP